MIKSGELPKKGTFATFHASKLNCLPFLRKKVGKNNAIVFCCFAIGCRWLFWDTTASGYLSRGSENDVEDPIKLQISGVLLVSYIMISEVVPA